jgi:predicted nucleic acid-binding protein
LILYFDSAYIGKCYLPEPDGPAVRTLARSASGLYSSAICIAEMSCILHRQMRERGVPPEKMGLLRQKFLEDLHSEIWSLIPVTERLLHKVDALVATLPAPCLIRGADAIHLTTAIDSGFEEIWTNDRRLLAAAEAAGIRGRMVDPPSAKDPLP